MRQIAKTSGKKAPSGLTTELAEISVHKEILVFNHENRILILMNILQRNYQIKFIKKVNLFDNY